MQTYDVVIISRSQWAAAYLLKAGYSVLLLEKRSVPGGEIMPKRHLGLSSSARLITSLFTWDR